MTAEHLEHLHDVFKHLTNNSIVVNLNTCVFGVKKPDFLGNGSGHKGITLLQSKVQPIREYPQPKTQSQLQVSERLAEQMATFKRNLPCDDC